MELKDKFGHKSMLSYLQTIRLDNRSSNICCSDYYKLQKFRKDIDQRTTYFNQIYKYTKRHYNLKHIFFGSNQHNNQYYILSIRHTYLRGHL